MVLTSEQLPSRYCADAEPGTASLNSMLYLKLQGRYKELIGTQVSIDEIRAHNRELADG
jgi:hypothetical protein